MRMAHSCRENVQNASATVWVGYEDWATLVNLARRFPFFVGRHGLVGSWHLMRNLRVLEDEIKEVFLRLLTLYPPRTPTPRLGSFLPRKPTPKSVVVSVL